MIEQAAHWHATLGSETVTEEEKQACAAWRAAHPSHEAAFQRLLRVWAPLESLNDELKEPALSTVQAVAGRKLRRRGARLASLAGAVLLSGWLSFQWLLPAGMGADHATLAGERRELLLDDGSRLLLNSRTAIDVRYSDRERRIVLHRGELLIDVGRDAARPFIVATRYGTAEALGTRYAVRQTADDAAVVTVAHSRVRFCPAPEASAERCRLLREGEQSRAGADGAATSAIEVDVEAATAWTRGRLVVDDWPLPQVLSELGYHRRGWLIFHADSLQDLRVSGVFPIDDTDLALAILEANLPLTISRYGPVTRIARH
ncbi:hypothetical protein CAI21_01920 [Alkalilimnicola ehrlichii]|uniref:Anti-FecI sigma factor, FecR n=2 Tax=Alkalilimnicola ehrlichii TaxID=351052 RepID=A0A3E0X105_9GAMM|nr:hypothetical protein CAI21_01920 [Alkalilimnicola ehrlichii]RFA39333.1 hypothetical protein CAL65_00480 [Alkalilimnicola ehrlichii]